MAPTTNVAVRTAFEAEVRFVLMLSDMCKPWLPYTGGTRGIRWRRPARSSSRISVVDDVACVHRVTAMITGRIHLLEGPLHARIGGHHRRAAFSTARRRRSAFRWAL